MSRHVDILMQDHALIERGLVLLEKEIDRGDKMNTAHVKTTIDFLLEYGDECHNMKEENVYFPLIQEKGLPPSGPVEVMLQEHKQERDMLAVIQQRIIALENGESLPLDFREYVGEYLELTKNHIWKENDILYPMGSKVLNSQDDDDLIKEFQRIEKESVGEGGYERFKQILETMEKKSGGRINLLESLSSEITGAMLDTIPVELTFVDADDKVRYINAIDEKKIFPRTLSIIGRSVQKCHPQKSVHLVNQILTEMKEGKRETATFWIHFKEMFVHITYLAVRDKSGAYLGCMEMVHDINPYREIEGDKKLLDLN